MLKVIQGIMQLTGLISPKLSAHLALYLCSKPKKHTDSNREKEQLNQGNKLTYKGALGTNNIAWSWGKGPVVILCHGWEARGSKMATLAMEIANAGFQAIAIDCTAHGYSAGKRSNFDIMARDIPFTPSHHNFHKFLLLWDIRWAV
ncbi:alpha/beta hydrolase [Shewanella surugensis]|uniref:Alpha/beta hydrolase n=1 Tax=Shewanella surugensis TaxID=212020 RepID=A0ABT0LI57_9GAMM|nr:alpha/beta hydrolase [Shewanella surugensis]MCL1126987.1 alpha/beta hydrolase [Shewanella surugensis]